MAPEHIVHVVRHICVPGLLKKIKYDPKTLLKVGLPEKRVSFNSFMTHGSNMCPNGVA